MARLTTRARKAIPTKDFALGGRRYPIEDRAHARNALARVSQFGSSSEQARVRSAVHAKYPSIGMQHLRAGSVPCRVCGTKHPHGEHRA